MNKKQIEEEEHTQVEAFKFWVRNNKEFPNLSRQKQQELIEYVTACYREISEFKALNIKMHNQVGGYLQGKEWEHWQKFNMDRFIID